MLKIIPMGPFDANCYLLYGKKESEAVLIDPSDADCAMKLLTEENLKLTHILLTHRHFDHLAGVAKLKQETNAEVLIHALDAPGLRSRTASMAMLMPGTFTPTEPTKTVSDGDVFEAAGYVFRILHTPGHTEGGVCFVCDEERIAFTGDTIFCESFGRTDMPGGSLRTLAHSICDTVLKLPADYTLYPGHGEMTTVAHECERNPILRMRSGAWRV